MKKFYNRETEMRQLKDMQQKAYEDCSRFVVLMGRRRVGKTSLVYRLMEDTRAEVPGLYFFVERKTCLIVSRSIFRMMEKIFKDEGQPPFGHDDCTIRLQPFTTMTIQEIPGDYKAGYTNEDLLA